MKKIIFIFIAILGISITANADGKTTCTIYNAGGAIAKLTKKGDQANDLGQLKVPVEVKNYKKYNSSGRIVKVWVEVVDQNTGRVVKRGCVDVEIKGLGHDGSGSVTIEGLTPKRDYLFRIDSAKSCDE